MKSIDIDKYEFIPDNGGNVGLFIKGDFEHLFKKDDYHGQDPYDGDYDNLHDPAVVLLFNYCLELEERNRDLRDDLAKYKTRLVQAEMDVEALKHRLLGDYKDRD